jgi:hypothetical protein
MLHGCSDSIEDVLDSAYTAALGVVVRCLIIQDLRERLRFHIDHHDGGLILRAR